MLLAITNGSWIAIAGCIVFLLMFVIRTRKVKVPFIQPKLFKSKKYTLGLIVAFFSTGIGYSLFFLTPQLLTDVNRLEPGAVGMVMMPAAIATAFMGRRGGKLADRKGNNFLFAIASGLYISCFTLMYAFAGISPIYISMILILGNVGQSFMYIALSNSISQTLPRDQSGVGMRLLSMLNFISGAVFASMYGKIVDHSITIDWTFIQISAEASVYNLIYFILSVLIVVISTLYFVQFGKVNRSNISTET